MKAVIFDFDGVIHNTFDLAFRLHLKFCPDSTKEKYLEYFDSNLFKKIGKKFSQEEVEEFNRLEFEAFKELELDEEIREELKKLEKKYDLFIITSNKLKNLNYYFRNNNFEGIFKEILGQEVHKSKKEKFKIIIKKYGLSEEDCIFVTDTLGDILEANEVGIRTIAVDFGFHPKERLERGRPFKIVSKFRDIRKTIEELENNEK